MSCKGLCTKDSTFDMALLVVGGTFRRYDLGEDPLVIEEFPQMGFWDYHLFIFLFCFLAIRKAI
jgi:hypothetical protein